jgi:nucleoside-diphosphate-sugar epimerase
MAVLVAGGTGFIGRRVCRRLAERGEPVICMDLNPEQSAFAGLEDRVTVVGGDVARFDDLAAAIAQGQVDRIINLAYMLGEGERQPHRATQVNVLGIDNTFEAARLFGIRRVVYASSIAFHGASQQPYGERPVTEEDPPYPGGVYSACKQFNEQMAAHYARLYSLEPVAVRPSYVIGAGKPRGVQDHVEVITRPALGQPVRSRMRPTARFLLASVDDIAEIFVRVTLADRPRHTVYHTGGHTVTLAELAGLVRELIPDADIQFDENSRDSMLVYLVDNSRLREEFEFEHRPLRQTVRGIVDATRLATGHRPPLGTRPERI